MRCTLLLLSPAVVNICIAFLSTEGAQPPILRSFHGPKVAKDPAYYYPTPAWWVNSKLGIPLLPNLERVCCFQAVINPNAIILEPRPSCLSLSRFSCSSRNSSASPFISKCRTLYRESKLFLCFIVLTLDSDDTRYSGRRDREFVITLRNSTYPYQICLLHGQRKNSTRIWKYSSSSISFSFETLEKQIILVEEPLSSIRIVILSFPITMRDENSLYFPPISSRYAIIEKQVCAS